MYSFILEILGQQSHFNSLHWFSALHTSYNTERSKLANLTDTVYIYIMHSQKFLDYILQHLIIFYHIVNEIIFLRMTKQYKRLELEEPELIRYTQTLYILLAMSLILYDIRSAK